MYPFFKLATTLIKAKFRPKLEITDSSVLHLRAGLTDIDVFLELNNARYFNYMELGRWDFSYRVGFVNLIKQKKWGLEIGGASVRYRRRIPLWRKFTLTTQLICHDERWYYFLQEIHSQQQICFSALIKAGVTSKNGLVPAAQVNESMGQSQWNPPIPEWIKAWIEAEGERPWPSNN